VSLLIVVLISTTVRPTAGASTHETSVTLEPKSVTAAPGEVITFDVILSDASDGVGTFDNITVARGDSELAEIGSISSDISSRADSSGAADGESAYVNVPFGGDTVDSGNVTIASVSVSALEAGTVPIGLMVTGGISNGDG